MDFAPSASWNSRSITHLANYPSRSLPMISSNESNSLNTIRVNSGETAETFKVGHVQCEYVAHAVHVHDGCHSRIVHLNSRDVVLHDNSSPLAINGFVVRQEDHARFDGPHLALCVGYGQAKAVAVPRACHGVPQLSNILMSVMKHGTLTGKLSERCIDDLVLGIGAPCHA